MAGKEDRATGRGRRLAEDHLEALQAVVDDCVAALVASPLKAGDLMAIERKARSAGVIARTIKLVDGLIPKTRKAAAATEEAADMSEDMTGHGDEMDPAEVAALRAELESRFHRLRTIIDRKRVAGEPERAGAEGAAGSDAAAA
jgi:hypothetical protein